VDDELTPEQKFASDPPEAIVVQGYLAGRAKANIVDDLRRFGWSQPKAEEFFDQMIVDLKWYHESPEARQQLLVGAQLQLWRGCLALLVSGGIAAALLMAAKAARMVLGEIPFGLLLVGMAFVVIPLLVGMVMMGQGWSRWRFYRRFRSLPPPTKGEAR
jgi:hypothetical protein